MKKLKFSNFRVIGPGAWGRALGSALKFKSEDIGYLDENSAPEDWKRLLTPGSLVVTATPFKALGPVLKELKKFKIAGVVNASKGIDRESLLTFTSLAKKSLKCPTATLSGPTFAAELAAQKPTACVVASKDAGFAKAVAEAFSNPYLRVYTNADPIGVEICGALKNVLAIACGISDGCNLGMNARAALLTRGLKEMEILVKALGGKTSSVNGLAGVGDLWLTATGDLSRNRQLGIALAKGMDLNAALASLSGPAEGFYTVMQVHQIAKKKKLSLPISEQVFEICEGRRKPNEALKILMMRELKPEDALKMKRA